jgi:hypothetical protein
MTLLLKVAVPPVSIVDPGLPVITQGAVVFDALEAPQAIGLPLRRSRRVLELVDSALPLEIVYAMFGAHLSLAGVEDDADGPWMGSFCVYGRAYGRAAADRSAA